MTTSWPNGAEKVTMGRCHAIVSDALLTRIRFDPRLYQQMTIGAHSRRGPDVNWIEVRTYRLPEGYFGEREIVVHPHGYIEFRNPAARDKDEVAVR